MAMWLHGGKPLSVGPEIANTRAEFHREPVQVSEDVDGRYLREALDYVSGERRFSAPSREHLLALFAYAESFRRSCLERDVVIAELLGFEGQHAAGSRS